MGCRGSLGDRNNLKGIKCEKVFVIEDHDERNSRWAPTKKEPRQRHLFGVIGNVRSKAIYCAAKVSIGALHNIGNCHERSQRKKNCSN